MRGTAFSRALVSEVTGCNAHATAPHIVCVRGCHHLDAITDFTSVRPGPAGTEQCRWS